MAFDPDAYLNEGKSSGSTFDPDAYLGIAPIDPPSFKDQVPGILKAAASAALESSPAKLTHRLFQTDPATVQKVGGVALPIAGGALAGPVGAAAGEFARQAIGTALNPETVPQTALGRAASVIGAGVAQEPKILNAIPGVSKVSNLMSDLASKASGALAKTGQTLSGAKADVLEQGLRQGYSTYLDPSLTKAKQIFSEALGPEGQAAMKPTASEVFDPALSKARGFASEIATKLENGEPISAIDALKARQATDRVISATPVTDKVARRDLYDWRTKFDTELSAQSGPLSDASKTYRKAIVRDQLLSPTRLNKNGEPSAFLPMIVGHGVMGNGMEAGLGMLTGTSPLAWGLGATTIGQAAKGLNVVGQNPTLRQALLSLLQKINSQGGQ